jgi:cephalosporin-C deacetylase-like acetyl esterase
MAEPDSKTLDTFLQAQARTLRDKDRSPTTAKEWQDRRTRLVKQMREAMGPVPEKDCPLDAKVLGTLERDGYVIERIVFQSRPDLWVTANAYVPKNVKGKVPAVLVVHGHWAGARRDPVVQARCLGLVKLGFFVLAVDAFGSGERYTAPALGTYHGALYGSTLWPTGHTLLGMQVYDNRRAVDYICTRPEVDGSKLGITGASGGGNQTMYAGAMDERFGAVVPVCSVGTYQAYLKAACCVCEVLPGALRFTEEGEVLGLVAPRALMVINATKDGFQFSVGEAQKSLARARDIFKVLDVEEKVKHATFESPHAYNQAMRELMYGWMTRWLKGEGKGEPIPEPAHKVESAEDLACWPGKTRPKDFLLLPAFAHREATALVKKCEAMPPKHAEDWEARSTLMRATLRKQVLGDFPTAPHPQGELGAVWRAGTISRDLLLQTEPGLSISAKIRRTAKKIKQMPVCLFLSLGDELDPMARPGTITDEFIDREWYLVRPELRGTGKAKPAGDAVGVAPDHNSTEHSLWIGRPLLGQWVFDLRCLLDWIATQPDLDSKRISVVGIGQAGVVAVCAAALLDDRIASVTAIDSPVSYVTEDRYGVGTRMGLLAPGILRVGDIPHLAALIAPRKLQIIGGVKMQGGKVEGKELTEAFSFTKRIYALHKADKKLVIADSMKPEDIVAGL